LFQIVGISDIYVSQGSDALGCGGIFNVSLHVYCWVRWWKNFENRSTSGEVMGNRRVSCFL